LKKVRPGVTLLLVYLIAAHIYVDPNVSLINSSAKMAVSETFRNSWVNSDLG